MRGSRRASAQQRARRASCSTQRPIGTISPVSSASGMNSTRRDQAALGVAPAQQRLEAGRSTPSGEPDDRLVVQLELAGVDRALQVGAQLEPVEHARVHRRLEQAVAALAVALGDVHRGVGVADQLLGACAASPAQRDRDADAGAQERARACPARSGAASSVEDALRGVGGRLAVDVLEQDARTRRRRSGRRCRRRARAPSRRRATSTSTSSPAAWPSESLIVLKSSRSRNSTRERRRPLAAGAGERLADALDEQRAVGEPGDRVVERLVGELGLERLALGDVAGVERGCRRRARSPVRFVSRISNARWLAVGADQRALERVRPPARRGGRVRGADALAVVVGGDMRPSTERRGCAPPTGWRR